MDKKYTYYADNVLNGNITACEYINLACRRYLLWLQRDDIEFKPDKADRVIKFISNLKHFTGSHNGKPFLLQEWQKWIIYNVYGFYWKDTNNRVCKNVYIEVARKNGKTAFAAALSLYNLIADGEHGAEVEFIANSRKQAGICFDMASNFCKSIDPKRKYFKLYRDKIKFDVTKSFLQVLSADAGNNDGWCSSMYVADEAHSYPNSLMYDVMKSSQGMRENPLAFVITTAGFNLFSFCYGMRKTNIEVLYDRLQDDTQFTAIFTLDENDDWENEDNWVKANPNLDVTVKRQYLREQIQQAKNNASLETSIRTKNFNQWLSSSDIWINNDLLLKHSEKVDLTKFTEYQCYMGVDLAAVADLTAVSVMIPTDDKFYFKTWYYLPITALSDNSNAELYKDWKRKGLLTTTDSNVTDYDIILRDILKTNELIPIIEISYDCWNATQWAINATEQGLPLNPYSQAVWNFNKPTKEFQRLILMGKVVIDDNPITRYCFSNVTIKEDYNGNTKPIKLDNMQKIDGVISMLEALGSYLSKPQYQNSIMAL